VSGFSRRHFVAAAAVVPLAGCARREVQHWTGGWVGDAHALGHRVRDAKSLALPEVQRRSSLIVIGAGIAGLAASRAAMRAGIDDVVVFDPHAQPGGNSRGHRLAGVPCPLGAHYLPLPGRDAHEVSEWLHEIGIATNVLGRTVYDERQLCHSPQERLFFEGAWHEGLLPPAAPGSATLAQYRRFAQRVEALGREPGFSIPTHRSTWKTGHAALDAIPFAHWLDQEGLNDAHLRWALDYSCRDDYGAGTGIVSAWAGLHYFASRHGFHAPGDEGGERDAVLTWPEGNARLVQHLAAPLADRLRANHVALRVEVERHEAVVDLWNDKDQRTERWRAPQVVMAMPLFIAARIVESPPAALTGSAAQLRYAPWLVANLQLDRALLDRPGAPPAWDNVSYGSAGLGYVNAQHQSLAAVPDATVITAYRTLPASERAALLERPWQHWAQAIVDDLAATHPDLPAKLRRIELARHGHAMSIPAPGVRGSAALQALREAATTTPRLHWAHADLAGYSIFEEAFTAGDHAGREAARLLHRAGREAARL
jgi:predicted NAD/FAD-dependent oxidoreductase